MPLVYIAIGSNLGNRQENCLRALQLLKQSKVNPASRSSMHETPPEGITEQPHFINMAVGVQTDLPPRQLLEVLKAIEKTMGREEAVRFGPRVIDLDILLYGDVVLDEPGLVVPHPRMHERAFVLGPLTEIAPDVMHPVLKKKVRELWID